VTEITIFSEEERGSPDTYGDKKKKYQIPKQVESERQNAPHEKRTRINGRRQKIDMPPKSAFTESIYEKVTKIYNGVALRTSIKRGLGQWRKSKKIG
jgi:hypothetical protein